MNSQIFILLSTDRLKRYDDYFKEMVALAQKVDRLEKWIHQIAKKIGLKLEY
jgi:hypothetical protein